MKRLLQSLLIFILIICANSGIAFAQEVAGGGMFDTSLNESDIDLEMTPANPDAGTVVSLRIRSDVIDLNRYNITWFSNGTVVKKGIGERTITITVPDYGKTLDIQVVTDLPTQSIRKILRLAPEDTTLLYEAVDAYVPAFYRGKKLPSKESIIRAVAIPNFSGTSATYENPKNSVFIWDRNDQVITAASGYGKDSFLLKHNKLRGIETIEVKASDANHSKESSQTISITPGNPRIILYTQDTTSGMMRAAKNNRLVVEADTAMITAEPYFFSRNTNGSFGNLGINWTLNTKPISDRTERSLLVQRPPENGTATFGITIQNTLTNLQRISKNFDIVFR